MCAFMEHLVKGRFERQTKTKQQTKSTGKTVECKECVKISIHLMVALYSSAQTEAPVGVMRIQDMCGKNYRDTGY